MISKNQIKHIKSLSVKKYRDIHLQFIAEGTKLVTELLNSSFTIDSLYATKKWIEKNYDVLFSKKIKIFETSEKELERISTLTTASEVLALVNIPSRSIDLTNLSKQLTLILDDIRDPGNLGTIIRTADWFGIKQIICSEECVDLFNPKVVQATMGSITRVKLHYNNLKQLIKTLPSSLPIYGALLDGNNIYSEGLSTTGIIIIGNESKGISEDILPFINRKITIPSYYQNKAESLNAAVATGIICSEFRRQNNT